MEIQMLPSFLKKRAFLTPERPAIQYGQMIYTFSDVYERAYQIAGHLTTVGMKKDQYVGVLLRNHADTAFILLALQLLQVKAVILNNRLTAEELIWQMNDSKSSFFITEKAFDSVRTKLQKSLPQVSSCIKEELFQSDRTEPTIFEEVKLDEVCTVMYTSGTTGHPKGVLQTYGNHWWSAVGSALNLGLSEKDCWLLAVPLFHISGYSILMRSIIYGMKIVIVDSFQAREAIETIQAENVTIMSVVSTMLARIVEELGERRLPSSFRCMLLGGGPAPKVLLEGCATKGIPVYQTYGMTETSSQIVTLSPEDSSRKHGSAGKALFPCELKIVDEQGKVAKQGQAGEIVVKGPNVTIGYLNRQEETEEKLKEGWLHTGDIGHMDADGFLYVLDRRSDLLISGGENVYPAEIEGVLVSHQAISDAGVIGTADPVWGQVPIAFVVKRTGASLTEDDVIQFSQQRLAKYKVPKNIYFTNEIPRNASKKIVRRKLRNYFDEMGEKE
ncbi:o-succinylbenzoate--CoA ligase [bacterium LRH843]|nr:o-succinylbenzoate--CoA ligase [bacterium LRH843]